MCDANNPVLATHWTGQNTALILGSCITWPDTLSHEYWSVLFPLLGKIGIMDFYDSPYCVSLTPCTSVGLCCKSEISEYVLFKSWSSSVDSLNSNPYSPKFLLLDKVQYSGNNSCGLRETFCFCWSPFLPYGLKICEIFIVTCIWNIDQDGSRGLIDNFCFPQRSSCKVAGSSAAPEITVNPHRSSARETQFQRENENVCNGNRRRWHSTR